MYIPILPQSSQPNHRIFFKHASPVCAQARSSPLQPPSRPTNCAIMAKDHMNFQHEVKDQLGA